MPAKPKTIDDYLARVSATQRAALEKLRRNIKSAAPVAEECVSYDIPGYRLGSRLLVSFYSGAHSIRAHRNELAGYDLAKGTIRFTATRTASRWTREEACEDVHCRILRLTMR
jgi:uncharacterized protein YdhG (YjbR/CyaY superfamily)